MSEPGAAGGTAVAQLFGGRLRLRQFDRGHRAGTDAVLLAAAAGLRPGERFVDVGAGVGSVGLWLGLTVPEARGVLLESHPATADLARDNAACNGLTGRIETIGVDLFDKAGCRRAGLERSADLVVTNPPFYAAGSVRVSPDAGKARAHVLDSAEPDAHAAWIRRCLDLLAPRGRLLVIHRPEVVPALLGSLANRVGGLRLLPIHPAVDRPAGRILLGGEIGSRAPLVLLPGLVLHNADGSFTAEAAALHGGQVLDFWPADRAGRRVRPAPA